MTEYISKSTLVAEIKARINDIEVAQKAGLIKKRDAGMKIALFKSILSFLDTLESKEVDEQIVRKETIEDVIDWIGHNIYIGSHFDLVVNNMRKELLNKEIKG